MYTIYYINYNHKKSKNLQRLTGPSCRWQRSFKTTLGWFKKEREKYSVGCITTVVSVHYKQTRHISCVFVDHTGDATFSRILWEVIFIQSRTYSIIPACYYPTVGLHLFSYREGTSTDIHPSPRRVADFRRMLHIRPDVSKIQDEVWTLVVINRRISSLWWAAHMSSVLIILVLHIVDPSVYEHYTSLYQKRMMYCVLCWLR